MKKVLVENAMMLCVGSRNWTVPKHVLVETIGEHGELLADIAYKAFDKYRKEQNDDIYLVSYSYYGDVEVMEGLT
jgi:hypothetical protein